MRTAEHACLIPSRRKFDKFLHLELRKRARQPMGKKYPDDYFFFSAIHTPAKSMLATQQAKGSILALLSGYVTQ